MGWRRIYIGLRGLFRRGRMEEELDEEMRLHIDLQTEANIEYGMSPKEARRAAVLAFGGLEQSKERCRGAWGVEPLRNLGKELGYSFRQIRKYKYYSFVIAATIAVCVGLNTSVMSVIKALRFDQGLYAGEERLVRVFDELRTANPLARKAWGTSVLFYEERKEQSQLIDSIALMQAAASNVSYNDSLEDPDYMQCVRVTPSLFRVLRSDALIGRVFAESDLGRGNDNVAVLTYDWWQKHYDGSPDVLDKRVHVDGEWHRIVGVMPEGFVTPPLSEDLQYKASGLLLPFRFESWQTRPGMRLAMYWGCYARLKPGVSLSQLEQELNAINQNNGLNYPEDFAEATRRGHRTQVWTLGEDLTRNIGRQLYILQAAMLFILLMGCVNVASLVLSHNSGKVRELGIRLAIGARKSRVVGQLTLEVWILAVAGGIVGFLNGIAVLKLLEDGSLFSSFLVKPHIEVDFANAAMVFVLSSLAAVVAGLISSLAILWKRDFFEGLRSGGRAGLDSGRNKLYRGGLVFVQVASTFVLLAGGCLLARSFVEILRIDPGFDTENVLTATVRLPWNGYSDADRRAFMFRLEAELENVPGVATVGLTNWPPMKMNSNWERYVAVEGEAPPRELPVCHLDTVNDGYFKALGITLLGGRLFNASDYANRSRVAIVDRIIAARYFGGEDPIGKRIALFDTSSPSHLDSEPEWLTVVGVVEPIRSSDLYSQPVGMIYRNYADLEPYWAGLAIKTNADPELVLARVKELVSRLAPGVAVARPETLGQAIAKRYVDRKGLMFALLAVALLAILLSALGLTGIIGYSLRSQRQEMAVRLALGATRATVTREAMGFWTKTAAAAVACGLVLAALLSNGLSSVLYQTSPFDPVAHLSTFVFLGSIVLSTIYIVARSMSNVEPWQVLREG